MLLQLLGDPRFTDDPEAAAATFEPRTIGAAILALVFGWFAMESYVVHSANLEDRDIEEVRADIARVMRHLMTRARAGVDDGEVPD